MSLSNTLVVFIQFMSSILRACGQRRSRLPLSLGMLQQRASLHVVFRIAFMLRKLLHSQSPQASACVLLVVQKFLAAISAACRLVARPSITFKTSCSRVVIITCRFADAEFILLRIVLSFGHFATAGMHSRCT